jgi:hypothetical protein
MKTRTVLAGGMMLALLGAAGVAAAQSWDHIDRGQTQILINGKGTHACPANHAMGGINFGADGNTFMCRYIGNIVSETFATVQREGMLACAPGSFMTALNIENNLLRCSRTGNPVSPAAVTSGVPSGQVTECGGSNPIHAGVMVGFHKERRMMLCAGLKR